MHASLQASKAILLRPWQLADKDSLLRYANNRRVWANLRDRFPHPYTEADADAWLQRCAAQGGTATDFAIECQGEAIGGVGLELLSDVNRVTAEVGYWIAEPFWGKGVATAAVRQLTAYAFAKFPLERLQATVFDWNKASARVLEKAGYTLEARLRRHFVKDGRIGDSLIYCRLRNSL